MNPQSNPVILACAGVFLAVLLPAQSVLVVDPVNGPYSTVQSAIDAATNGDTVLIKGTSFDEGIVIDGKGLTVVAETSVTLNSQFAPPTACWNAVCVRNTTPNQGVRIRGVTGLCDTSLQNNALQISNCQGPVVIEDCAFLNGLFLSCSLFPPLTWINNSSQVTFVRCGLGCDLAQCFSPMNCANDGAAISGSQVAFYSCFLQGGSFGDPDFTAAAGVGGAGLVVNGATVFASNTVIRGGAGSSDGFLGSPCAYDGGPGMTIVGASSQVRLLETTVTGGPGGLASGFPTMCIPSVAGPDFVYTSGASTANVTTLPAPSRQFRVDGPIREGNVASFVHAGQPGDLVLWSSSLGSGHTWLAGARGVLVTDPGASAILQVGFLDASGTLTLPLVAPMLPPGIDGGALTVQAGYLTNPFSPLGFDFTLGDPTQLVILDASL